MRQIRRRYGKLAVYIVLHHTISGTARGDVVVKHRAVVGELMVLVGSRGCRVGVAGGEMSGSSGNIGCLLGWCM